MTRFMNIFVSNANQTHKNTVSLTKNLRLKNAYNAKVNLGRLEWLSNVSNVTKRKIWKEECKKVKSL